MGEVVSAKGIAWRQDDETSTASNLVDSDSKEITTVIIFVISAILAITLLFVIAIFIDCRQQKLQKLQSKPKRKLIKLRLPIPIIGRSIREDQNSILDKMEHGEPSSSNVNVM